MDKLISNIASNEFDPISLMLKIIGKKNLPGNLFDCLQKVSPKALCSIVNYSAPYTWFGSTIYEEVLKRYETISYILSTEDDPVVVEKLIRIFISLRMELRPLNNEVLKISSNVFQEALKSKKPIHLASLTCPAYTLRREGIANNLIEDRINYFVELVSKSIGPIDSMISQWDIYIWDPSNLNDPILKKTVHPNLFRKKDLELQLERNWNLFNEAAEKISRKLKIEIVCKRYRDILPEIYIAKDILDDKERKTGFLSKCVTRIIRHGREDYRKMGEDIEEHRDRFWNDSYIYTGAILKYGIKNNHIENPSIMISIESRIHHITGLRLYHFLYGKDTYLMPVWNYPTWIRSFYWVNNGNVNTTQKILDTRKRWRKYEEWKKSWFQKTLTE